MWFWLITIVSNVDNKFSDGGYDYSIAIWPSILVSTNYFKFAKWHKVFSNILFLVQLRGFGQSISRLNLIKNWQKCQKTCPIFCSFGFNKSWSEYSLAQGILSSTFNTFNYSLNEFNSIGWKFYTAEYQEQVLVWFFSMMKFF